MILAQVREDERGEADAIEAAELRAVRRRLHRAAAVTGVEHLPESPLDVNRLRRGPSGRPAFASDPALDRPDQPRSCPRSGEDRVEQKRGGRLAVRAGHAGDLELLARVPEELVRDDRHRAAGVRDDELGDIMLERALDDERDSAVRDRFGSEVVPVGPASRDTEEEHARADGAGVVGEIADLHGSASQDVRGGERCDDAL